MSDLRNRRSTATADSATNDAASILKDPIDEHDIALQIKSFEEAYAAECMKPRPAPEAKFNYAWALIRSKNRADIRKGIKLMRGLHEDRFSDRDCLYYMALGHYRVDELLESRRCLHELLRTCPDCRQGISLLDIVDDKIFRDGFIGIGITGALIAAIAGLALAAQRH